jgi:hypothetical protein
MPICGAISANMLIDCANPIIGGVKDRLILINRADVASVTRNGTNPQIIEAVTKNSGKVGYLYEGIKSSIDVKVSMVAKKYAVGFSHEITFRVFSNDANTKKQLSALARGEVLAFLENNYRGAAGESSFEMYGWGVGLVVSAMETNKSDSDTQGAYVITLSAPPDKMEPQLPETLFITSYAASLAVFNGLLV